MPHITDIACVAGVVCRAKLPDTCQFLWNVLGQKLLEVKRQRLLDVGFFIAACDALDISRSGVLF